MIKTKNILKKITSGTLVASLALGSLAAVDTYYQIDTVKAASLVAVDNGTSGDQTIKGAQNMGTLDNSGNTTYWFAGNGFYGLNRSTTGFGESYDASDWLLVDTDAMWGGKYLYSQFGDTGVQNGTTYADSTPNYYQKILTYGEGLWALNKDAWFTGKEQSAVGTATVSTSNENYRTYEKVGKFAQYNYETAATSAEAVANFVQGGGTLAVTQAKLWYDIDRNENVNGGYQNATNTTSQTNGTSAVGYPDSSNSLNDENMGIGSSNVYTVTGAHLYAPSYNEMESNHSAVAKIVDNMNGYQSNGAISKDTGDFIGKSSSTNWATSFAEGNATQWYNGGYNRTDLWSRSFSGLRVCGTDLDAWYVHASGDVDSHAHVASSYAVAPAFNLDSDAVVMARSAQASVTPSSELASYNPNELGADVTFTLESDSLNIDTGLDAKKLTNVVAGQTYDIAYSNASTTGEAHNSATSATLYVSAAIYNSNNEMMYYGQLGQVEDDGEGTVSLTIPDSLESGVEYKLAIFEEQIDGSYAQNTPSGKTINTYTTDYVSAMDVANFTLDSLSATVNEGETLTEETEYQLSDIASKITVTSSSKGELVYGTDYKFSSFDGSASLDGSKIITGDNGSKNSKSIVFTIDYMDGTDQTVVPSTAVELIVVSRDEVSDKTYQQDQESEKDENGFYTFTDETTGITWKYKTDDNGNINALYTADAKLDSIITQNQILVLPKQINGLTVVAIGGGAQEFPVIPSAVGSIKKISLPETVTTINDYAFLKLNQPDLELVIPSTVQEIGAKAFYKGRMASIKIDDVSGNIGYLAFGKITDVSNIVINGNGLTLGEESFNGLLETSLTLSGNISVGKNAFKDNTQIMSLYLPETVTVKANAFNGCSGLETIETNMTALPNNSFEGCTGIKTVILDDNVQSVNYNWNGQDSDVDRSFYVKNESTMFDFYNKGTKNESEWVASDDYQSAYGTSGKVTVYYDGGSNDGADLTVTYNESGDGILTSNTKTLDNNKNVYEKFAKGKASAVTYKYDVAKTVEQMMAEGDTSDVNVVPSEQSGIEAKFLGTLLTGQAIDKTKVDVSALFGNTAGNAYDAEHFYVIRSSEYAQASREGNLTEDTVAAFEPLTANDDDLTKGLDAAIITFYSLDSEGNYEYVDTPFVYAISIRVEKYTDQAYVEDTYGGYDKVVEKIQNLNNEVSDLENSMKTSISSINSILGTSYDENASDVASEYKKALKALSDSFTVAASNNTATIENVKAWLDIVNSTFDSELTLSDDATASDINKALTDVLTVVDSDRQEKANTITSLKQEYVDIAKMLSDYVEDTDGLTSSDIDNDKIVEIKKGIAAALKSLQDMSDKLTNIGDAINNSSLDTKIDDTSSVDEVIKGVEAYIKEAEQLLNDKNTLAGQLNTAQTQAENYSQALNSIYEILSSEDLTISDLESAITAINALNSRITSLDSQVASLQKQLDTANEQNKELTSNLESVNEKIQEAEKKQAELDEQIKTLLIEKESLSNQITETEQEKEKLQADYEQAIKDGNEEAAAKLQEQIDANQKTLDELNQSKSDLEEKETELTSYKEQVAKLQEQLTAIQTQLTDKDEQIKILQEEIKALQESASNYQMTVENANKLFGLSLDSSASNEEVEAAIRDYVNQKVANDGTIKKIQELIGSDKTGDELVAQVSEAVSTGGYDDSVIDKNSNNYKSGYADGVASVTVEDKTEEIATLTAQVKTLSETNNTLSNKVKELSDTNATLSSQIQSLTSDKTTLTTKINELTATNSSLSDNVNTLSAENKALTSKVSALSSSNNKTNTNSSVASGSTVSSGKANTTTNANTGANVSQSKSGKTSQENASGKTDVEESTENSKTVVASTFKVSSGASYEQGTPVAISMPDVTTANTVAENQVAVVKLNKISSSSSTVVESNGAGSSDSTDAQKNSAYTILNYYVNHLDELVDLGATKLDGIATDDSSKVSFDVLASMDIEASDEQKEAIENGENADLELKSDAFEDDELYFVVHESTVRENTFDVEVVTAHNGQLNVALPDLSPVTVAHIAIGTVVNENASTEVLAAEEVSDTSNTDKTGLRNLALVLMVVAVAGGATVIFVTKRRKSSVSNDDDE